MIDSLNLIHILAEVSLGPTITIAWVLLMLGGYGSEMFELVEEPLHQTVHLVELFENDGRRRCGEIGGILGKVT